MPKKPGERSPPPKVSPYQPPTKGWLAHAPSSWVPYFELMRLDRPNGYWYFWFPHFFGSVFAATLKRSHPLHLLYINAILIWGVLIMRGATCTWNDTVDVNFDRQVSRCKNRPIARGAVSITQANIFTACQTVLSLASLALLPPVCFLYAIPGAMGWIIYPLAKRVTFYPQVILGFPMAWGVFMGAAAMEADPLGLNALFSVLSVLLRYPDLATIQENLQQGQSITDWQWSLCALYAANVLWTLLYETIYSHQDAPEDAKAGVKNIVLLYKNKTMPLLVKLAVGQVLFLAQAGVLRSASPFYYLFVVGGTASSLVMVLTKVRLTDPADCAWWFKVGIILYTGGVTSFGLLVEYIVWKYYMQI